MKIVYDSPKRLANLLKHGLDFADLEDGAFFETALVRPANWGVSRPSVASVMEL